VVNNIDDDHLDYFKDIEHIYQAFYKFAALMPADGMLFGCADDLRVLRLVAESGKPSLTYGLTGGDYTANNIETDADGMTSFEVVFQGEPLMRVTLGVPGFHNVLNSLAAIAVARFLGADKDAIVEALREYRLTRRRFELYGEKDGVKIYHDYAHHPAEIAACLQAARSVAKKRLFVVFQCNSYTRAKTLFTEHVTCFANADDVLVPDIYPGREVDTGIVHAKDMVAAICKESGNAQYIPTFESINDYLRAHWQAGDIVVTLGSGDVYIQTRLFLKD
jgi:UDP-N-acetylmuramate--alanine ligase